MRKQLSAAERASKASRVEQANEQGGASKRANEQASGPVFMSGFLIILALSATLRGEHLERKIIDI